MKTTSYYSLILLFSFPLCCIANITDWYKIKTDRSGNIYVLGEYNGKITIDSIVLGDSTNYRDVDNSNYFIAKFTSSGTLIWADSIAGVETNCFGNCPGFTGLAIDNDNDIIISLSSFDSTIYRGVPYYQPNIIKLDSSGNLLWTKRIREWNLAETDVSTDSKNNIYYASVFENSVISDTVTLITCDSTTQKSFITKVSPSGTTKWIREIASPISGHTSSMQECFFITVDSNGNSYVGGAANNTISLGSDYLTCAGFYPFLAKLDSNGNPGFLKGYFERWIWGTGYSMLSDGCVSKYQKLYTGGSFRDSVYVGPSSIVVTKPNVITPYLAHTNISTGDEMWYQYNQDLYSPSYWNNLYSVSSDSLNNLLVIGDIQDSIQFYNGVGLSTLTPSLSNTYFAKFDSSGNFQCYKTDSSRLITGTAHGSNYYTIGLSNNVIVSGVLYNSIELVKWDINTCSEVWRNSFNQVVVMPTPESTPKNIKNDKYLSFFPNPNVNGIFFKKTNNLNFSIEIFNLIGQKVEFQDSPNLIDISKQPKGIYLYRAVFSDQTVESGKIIYQ